MNQIQFDASSNLYVRQIMARRINGSPWLDRNVLVNLDLSHAESLRGSTDGGYRPKMVIGLNINPALPAIQALIAAHQFRCSGRTKNDVTTIPEPSASSVLTLIHMRRFSCPIRTAYTRFCEHVDYNRTRRDSANPSVPQVQKCHQR